MLAAGVELTDYEVGKIINNLHIAQFFIVALQHFLVAVDDGLQDGFCLVFDKLFQGYI